MTADKEEVLSLDGLETVYDDLASAIDDVEPEKVQLFLVKLALLSANALGDSAEFRELLRVARLNL